MGVRFGDWHSDSENLILTAISTGVPTPKRTTVDITGRNGKLDLTQKKAYGNKPIEYTFEFKGSAETYADKWSAVMAAVHGKDLKVIEDNDASYYWDAFVSVSGLTSDRHKGQIKISCDCQPYKLKVAETVRTVTAPASFILSNEQMEVVPTVTCTAAVSIKCGQDTVSLGAGTYELPGLALGEGSTAWTVTGSGTVTVRYREGRL